jgi:hypothetical protein
LEPVVLIEDGSGVRPVGPGTLVVVVAAGTVVLGRGVVVVVVVGTGRPESDIRNVRDDVEVVFRATSLKVTVFSPGDEFGPMVMWAKKLPPWQPVLGPWEYTKLRPPWATTSSWHVAACLTGAVTATLPPPNDKTRGVAVTDTSDGAGSLGDLVAAIAVEGAREEPKATTSTAAVKADARILL